MWTATRLIALAVESFFDKKLKARIESYNASTAEHQAKREQYIKKYDSQRSVDVESVDFAKLLSTADARIEMTTLLQEELRIRRECSACRSLAIEAYKKEYTAASARIEPARAKVVEALLSIGYLPECTDEFVPGAIRHDWPNRHPTMIALRAHEEKCFNQVNSHEGEQANAAAAEEVLRRLARIRDDMIPATPKAQVVQQAPSWAAG